MGHTQTWSGCSDEFFVSAALLRDLAERERRDTSEADLERIGVERSCMTWIRWRNCLRNTPLELPYVGEEHERQGFPHFYGKAKANVDYAPAVTLTYLRKLVVEEGFMFGRKFAKGTMVEDADSLKPLNETLPGLWLEVNEAHTSG